MLLCSVTGTAAVIVPIVGKGVSSTRIFVALTAGTNRVERSSGLAAVAVGRLLVQMLAVCHHSTECCLQRLLVACLGPICPSGTGSGGTGTKM